MTRGFYEQLGVEPSADPDDIRHAYHRLVAQFNRRRQALLERGGDPSQLELSRHQADEAFQVLSAPARRRRYDALLALQEEGLPRTEGELWEEASGAMVPEEVSTAIELLVSVTDLAVEPFDAPPSPVSTEPEPQPLRSITGSTGADVMPMPNRTLTPPGPDLRVVHGADKAAPVIVMPTPTVPSIDMPAPTVVPPVAEVPAAPKGPAGFLAIMGPTGPMLRALREDKGLTLEQMGEQSGIAPRFLEAIEAEAFERMPSATFVRGYVREMCDLLGLDEDAVVEGYMERFHGSR